MSELRQDLVSGDWIIVSPERAGRHRNFKNLRKAGERNVSKSKKGCPFEDLIKSGNWPPIFAYPTKKNWKIIIFQNKYPALSHQASCSRTLRRGPYSLMSGVGHHDLLVTRNHNNDFEALSPNDAFLVFKVLQKYYDLIEKDPCLNYISFFHNWGPTGGATIFHPHYQVVSLPIIPPDVKSSLDGSKKYFAKHHTCVHCAMIKYEKKAKERLIFENKNAIAFAPFVSRQPFEIRIFPKKHCSSFELTADDILRDVSEALRVCIKKMKKQLNSPDYNFFIHTSPVKNEEKYQHYHWHIEILPKLSFVGGFELGTGVDINVIDPDLAAKILRKK